MTDAPTEELGTDHPGILAAVAFSDERDRSLSQIWLGPRELRGWLTSQEVTDRNEQKLLVEAIASIGRATRADVSLGRTNRLTRTVTLHSSSSRGLPPTINALDVQTVINDTYLLRLVRRHQSSGLPRDGVRACRDFIQRILTTKHRPGIEALAS